MADYGLITKNEYGGVQIDSMFQNFVLQESKNITLNFIRDDLPRSVEVVFVVPIPSSSVPPLIAIKPNSSDFFVSILGYTMQNGAYNGMCITGGKGSNLLDPGRFSINFDYIVGRGIGTAPSGAYGMAVYDSNGKVCFHSSYRYLKILSTHDFVLPAPEPYDDTYPYTGTYPYVDISHPGVYNPYYILTPNWAGAGTAEFTGGPPPNRFSTIVQISVGMKRLSTESVRIGSFVFNGGVIQGYPIPLYFRTDTFTLLTCTV